MKAREAGKPNELLRQQRLLRGWSLARVADELRVLCEQSHQTVPVTGSMIWKWEQGKHTPSPFYRDAFCRLYKLTADKLGFIDALGPLSPSEGQSQPITIPSDAAESTIQSEDTLAITLSSLVLGLSSPLTGSHEIDKEIDRLLTRRLARLQNWVTDGLEDGTQLRWQLYYTSRNSLTENGLLSQIARLEQLADNGGEHHQRICRILAQNYQLAGNVARDRFQYTKALEFFQKAEGLHEDTQLSDLTATAITRQAMALLRKDPERYLSKSLTLYSSALDKAKHAEPYTQAYVLSRRAEALARKGDYDACIRSLEQAETLLSRAVNIPVEEDLAYVHLSLQSLTDSRGECYVLLGKPEKGLEHLQAAQKKLNQKMSRNNCRLLMQQSEAYLAAGQPDACVQQALKGLEIARILESTSNIHWAEEILAKLRSSAFCNEPVVDELYEAIRG
jgi:transcriptional regulator with XRE-family HTH domain